MTDYRDSSELNLANLEQGFTQVLFALLVPLY